MNSPRWEKKVADMIRFPTPIQIKVAKEFETLYKDKRASPFKKKKD